MNELNFEVPYIAHQQYYKRILKPIKSFPFPPDLIHEPLISDLFFTERVDGASYLRHVQVSFFCLPVYIEEIEISVPINDEFGNLKNQNFIVEVRYVEFSNQIRSVGYKHRDIWTHFIDEDLYEGRIDHIPNSLKQLYISSGLMTPSYLKDEEERMRNIKIQSSL
jgi:hypothetical protein